MLEPRHVLAAFPEELACPVETKASMLHGHVSLSPLAPTFLLPKGGFIAVLCADVPPFGAAPCAAKAALAARAKASGGGFTFTTIITPQGACQLLCSVVIKTSTLKIQGGFPSVSALLCVGRSLIHGSVLQPSHDRWVGWSETQDAVTHEIVPAAQGCHSPSQHPKLCPGCCSIPRGGDVPLAAACQAQKLHHDLMALHEGLMKQMKGM